MGHAHTHVDQLIRLQLFSWTAQDSFALLLVALSGHSTLISAWKKTIFRRHFDVRGRLRPLDCRRRHGLELRTLWMVITKVHIRYMKSSAIAIESWNGMDMRKGTAWLDRVHKENFIERQQQRDLD